MKLNGQTTKIIGMAAVSLLWLGGISYTVADNGKEIEQLKETPLKIVGLEKDVGYLKEGQDDIKAEMRAQAKKLDEILKAVNGG